MQIYINQHYIGKQKGAVLLLFFMLLIIAGLTFSLIVTPNNSTPLKRQNLTTQSLAKAKEALIAYAVTNYYRTNPSTRNSLSGWHGYLPCVEGRTASAANEGRQNGGNSCPRLRTNALGRLPWKSLNIEPLKDSAGQCLWYAVTYSFTQNSNLLHNSDSVGMFDIYNITGHKLNSDRPEDRIVAVVFAPGEELSGQSRSNAVTGFPCGQARDQVQARNFLEGISGIDNSSISSQEDTVDSFVGISSTQLKPNFNDRLITITQYEIFNAIQNQTNSNTGRPILTEQLQNLGKALAECLIIYSNEPINIKHNLFWPAAVDMQNAGTNDDYRNNNRYIDLNNTSKGYLGRFPLNIPNSNLITGVSNSKLLTYCTLTQSQSRLWRDWKDHIFLVIGSDYIPGSLTRPCSSSTCATLGTNNYPALIIIANTALANQRRLDSDLEPVAPNAADLKGNINNYLEANNASNYGPTNSLGSYVNTGNDIFIAIKETRPLTATCFNLNTLTQELCPSLP